MKEKQIILKKRPCGIPSEENFDMIEREVREIMDGEVQIQTLFLSVDPYMRERMTPMKSHMESFGLKEVITGTMIGKIMESKHPDFTADDIVSGFLGWQEFPISNGTNIRKIEPLPVPYQAMLSVLGSPGLTAFFGLLDVGKPKSGETIVISGAAGAVGSMVGQIAKIHGCRVIGISGSDDKNAYLVNELGFDGAINYKTEEDIEGELRKLCPDGIDIYFDNVGNEWINNITKLINPFARIVLCGQISQYNGETPYIDPKIFGRITKNRAIMEGFLITGHDPKRSEAARSEIAQWIVEGRIKYTESISDGLDSAPKALIDLFHGKNIGKQLVRLGSQIRS